MKFGSLFSGVGGLDLGLERAGMVCQWQVENHKYANKVLEKHWPDVTRFLDVREVGAHNLTPVDLICGGFPCQDISNAGHRAGIEGERSGLWKEYHRIINELQPRYVLIENVAALRYRGLDVVLSDLAESGYDAEWQTLQALMFGAFHRRERIFIVAYRHNASAEQWDDIHTPRPLQAQLYRDRDLIPSTHWQTNQPSMVGMAYGVPHRLDRIRGIGNAVVPQVAEFVGRAIMAGASEQQQQLDLLASLTLDELQKLEQAS